MQISSVSNLNSLHQKSFKGLLKINNDTYVNTDYIVSINDYSDKNAGKKTPPSVTMVGGASYFCQNDKTAIPIETVIDGYYNAAVSKTMIVDVSNGCVSIDKTRDK